MSFPPEPWLLRGRLVGSACLVPAAALPAAVIAGLPPGWQLVRVAGRVVVGVVWVDYRPGGVLAYRELMATVLVRRGAHVVPSVVAIWVDSEASRDGGRALWGIPKGLARFRFDDDAFAAELPDGSNAEAAGTGPTGGATGAIARGRLGRRVPLPGRWPVRFGVAQRFPLGAPDARAKVSPVRCTARVELAGATVDAVASGPLGFLAGARPLASFVLEDFRMTFGTDRSSRT